LILVLILLLLLLLLRLLLLLLLLLLRQFFFFSFALGVAYTLLVCSAPLRQTSLVGELCPSHSLTTPLQTVKARCTWWCAGMQALPCNGEEGVWPRAGDGALGPQRGCPESARHTRSGPLHSAYLHSLCTRHQLAL